MFAYLLGMASKQNKNEEIDLEKIDIPRLESIVREAKFAQHLEKYNFSEEDAKNLAVPTGFERNKKAVDIINAAIVNASITREEAILLVKELALKERTD